MTANRVAFNQAFDAIIVGAGPAGCVLASRLSEDASKHVLLIEAGPDVMPCKEPSEMLDPFALSASLSPAFHWPGLLADAHPVCGQKSPREPRPYIQASCLGGASNINGMGVDRGLPGDYEQWERLGAEGWGWKDVLPYFKKLERELDFRDNPSMHGYSGPMPVRRLPKSRWAPFVAAVADALQRRGLPFIEDYIVDFRDGVAPVPTNNLFDRRMSASMAYLTEEVRARPNLQVLACARADRLSIEARRANGVFVHFGGITRLVRGRKILVCGGALQSPALLLRSGIGPASHLAEHGIGVVRDTPGVGANLQNHPCLNLVTYLSREAAQPPENIPFLQNWARFSSRHPDCDPSDMHLMAFNKHAWHALGRRIGSMAVSVLNAYSKGRVQLASADPGRSPKVQFNLLGDRRDEERMVSAARFALELFVDPSVKALCRQVFFPNARIVASLSKRTAWNAFNARLITWLLDCPPLRRLLLATASYSPEKLLADDRALRAFVVKYTRLQFHIVGTCRMGRADDPDSVVDNEGRVHGIEALHVADASIFPTITRGYTHFIVIMAAEKIAHAINVG